MHSAGERSFPLTFSALFKLPASLCCFNGCFTGWSATIDFATFVEDFRLVSPLPELKLIQPRPTHSNGPQFGCHAENLKTRSRQFGLDWLTKYWLLLPRSYNGMVIYSNFNKMGPPILVLWRFCYYGMGSK